MPNVGLSLIKPSWPEANGIALKMIDLAVNGDALYAPLVTATDAFAARVSEVLLVMVATVPMVVPPEFLITVPTERSVVNDVPVPVTVVEPVLAVIVPVRVTSDAELKSRVMVFVPSLSTAPAMACLQSARPVLLIAAEAFCLNVICLTSVGLPSLGAAASSVTTNLNTCAAPVDPPPAAAVKAVDGTGPMVAGLPMVLALPTLTSNKLLTAAVGTTELALGVVEVTVMAAPTPMEVNLISPNPNA